MSMNGEKEWKLPNDEEELKEELKILSGAIYNLMQQIPNCCASISVYNHSGKSEFVTISRINNPNDIKVVCNEYRIDDKEWIKN